MKQKTDDREQDTDDSPPRRIGSDHLHPESDLAKKRCPKSRVPRRSGAKTGKSCLKLFKIESDQLSQRPVSSAVEKLYRNLGWYPPAETKIPLNAILKSLISYNGDFKKALCNYLGVSQCVLANSGRALLYLLLEILKRKDGGACDEVVIPGYTCYSVAASIAKAGLKINVYDLDPGTLQPDFNSLRKSTSEKTLAIIFQHLFGVPTSGYEFKKLAQETGVAVIEDGAQALGGSIDSHRLGTIGDYGFYSFGRGKPLAIGNGGALIGKKNDILSELELKLSNKGYGALITTALTQIMSKPSIYWIPEMLPLGLGETIFDTSFDASAMQFFVQNLAENSMDILDDLNGHRRDIAKAYEDALDDDCVIPIPAGGCAVYTRFPFMAKQGLIPEELKRLGVRRMYPKAIADEQTIRRHLADEPVSTPGASEIARNLITLPTHTGITKTLAKEIAQKVKDSY